MQKVSIIVPVYNAQEYLATCVDSLRKQLYPQIEIILVDDGSTDNSGLMCDAYEEEDARIHVYHKSNSGVSAARNFGIERATGEYILFVDADDSIDPDTVMENVEQAEINDAELVIFSFRYYMMDDHNLISNLLDHGFVGESDEFFQDYFIPIIDHELLNPPWNKLIRRSLLEENCIRFNREFSICEDMAFSTEVLKASHKIVLNNHMYYNYCLKSQGSLVFRFHDNYFEALSYFYQQAQDYCEQFDHNENQKQKLYSLFASLGMMYIKQICCKKEWSKSYQVERIKKILMNSEFRSALNHADLTKKKRVIRFLIRKKRYGVIYGIYHCRNSLQELTG